MKNFAMFSFFVLTLLFSQVNFSQTTPANPVTPTSPAFSANKFSGEIWDKRRARIKAVILDEIKTLKPKEQLSKYLGLSSIYSDTDKKEALFWITKAHEIATNPATEYRDRQDEIDSLMSLYYHTENTSVELSAKTFAKISQLLSEEMKTERADEYSYTFLALAEAQLKKDEKSAFDFAALSLKGTKPALSYRLFQIILKLKQKNEPLASRLFDKILDAVKASGKIEHLRTAMGIGTSYSQPGLKMPYFSDQQTKALLDVLAPFIRRESEELFAGQKKDCPLTKSYAIRHLDTYRKLSPANAVVVEQALNLCNAADIAPWEKPDFFRDRKPRTSREYLELAKEIGDREARLEYLSLAISLARSENDYPPIINILDSIENDLREKIFAWDGRRVDAGVALLLGSFRRGDFTEAAQIIEQSPSNLRPYILLGGLRSLTYSQKTKQAFLEFAGKTKAEFQRMDFPPPNKRQWSITINPAKFGELVNMYFQAGFREEALATFGEYVTLLNLLSSRFTAQDEKGATITYFYYSSLDQSFLETEFEMIYQQIERVESPKMRLSIRLFTLDQLVNPNKSSSISGFSKDEG